MRGGKGKPSVDASGPVASTVTSKIPSAAAMNSGVPTSAGPNVPDTSCVASAAPTHASCGSSNTMPSVAASCENLSAGDPPSTYSDGNAIRFNRVKDGDRGLFSWAAMELRKELLPSLKGKLGHYLHRHKGMTDYAGSEVMVTRRPDPLFERKERVRAGRLGISGLSFQCSDEDVFDALFLPPVDESMPAHSYLIKWRPSVSGHLLSQNISCLGNPAGTEVSCTQLRASAHGRFILLTIIQMF
jgi:hypothetical protein